MAADCQAGDSAHLGRRPNGGHQNASLSPGDCRPGKHHRRSFGQRRCEGDRRGALLDRDRFAGQRGFVCRDAFSGHEPSVSGNAPSFAKDEEISLDDRLSRDDPLDHRLEPRKPQAALTRARQ